MSLEKARCVFLCTISVASLWAVVVWNSPLHGDQPTEPPTTTQSLTNHNASLTTAVRSAKQSPDELSSATAQSQWQRVLTGEDKTHVEQLEAIITDLLQHGKASEAIEPACQALNIRSRVQGADHWMAGDVRRKLETAQYIAGLPRKAQHELAQAYRLDPDIAHSEAAEEYDNAIALARKQLDLLRANLPGGNQDIVQRVVRLSGILPNIGDLKNAESSSREAVDLCRSTLPAAHPLLATSLYNQAIVYIVRGDFALAQSACGKALDLRRRLLPHDDPDIAQSLIQQGRLYYALGDPETSEPLLREALNIRRAVFPPGHRSIAHAMDCLASCLAAEGDWAPAEGLYREAISINNIALPHDSPIRAIQLNNLAALLAERGDFQSASSSYSEAVQTWRSIPNLAPWRLGTLLTNWAGVLIHQGELAHAEKLIRESLDIYRKTLPKGHPLMANALFQLARVLTSKGDLTSAERLYREALDICLSSMPKDHPQCLNIRYWLAEDLQSQGNKKSLDEAERLYREALSLERTTAYPLLAVKKARYAYFILRYRQEPEEAISLFSDAIEQIEGIRTNVTGDALNRSLFFGELSSEGAFGGMARAQMALSFKKHDFAAMADALTYLERGRGRSLLDLLGRSDRNLARALVTRTVHKPDAALRGEAEAIRRHLRKLKRNSTADEKQIEFTRKDTTLGNQRKQDRIAKLTSQLNAARDAERQVRKELFDLVRSELGDGGLQPMTATQIAAGLRPGEILLAYDVGHLDSVLLVLWPDGDVKGYRLKWPDENDIDSKTLTETVARSFDSMFPSHGKEDISFEKRRHYLATDLFKALIPEELRREMLSAKRVFIVADGSLDLLPFESLIVNSDRSQCWIDVGPTIVYGPSGTVLMVKRETADKRRQHRSELQTMLVALGDPTFAPKEPPLLKTTPSHQAPQFGILLAQVTVDLNAARNGVHAGDVLLTYNGIQLRSWADLGPIIKRTQESTQASDHATRGSDDRRIPIKIWRDGQTLRLSLALGPMGVVPSRLAMPEALRTYREFLLNEKQRSALLASAHSRGDFGTLTPLPGTRAEVDMIESLVRKRLGQGASLKVLTGRDATLSNLFRAIDHPRFLHLATHGLVQGGRRIYESALALSIPEELTREDNGFLRLEDILQNWGGKLEGTELVVLSACRTARGQMVAGDGFVGLTWGFLFAGADSVVASLWKVDDTATAFLMQRFYENLLGEYNEPRGRYSSGAPMPKAEALREAKRWLRALPMNQVRALCHSYDLALPAGLARGQAGQVMPLEDLADTDNRPYKSPYYWAPFLLIGDPG